MDKLNNENINYSILKEKQFYLTKDNCSYKCILIQADSEIIIKMETYEMKLNLIELQKLIINKIKTINNFFDFFQDLFEKNEIFIKDFEVNKILKLALPLKLDYINSKENEIELILIHKEENKDYIINYLNRKNIELIKKISDLSKQNEKHKKELKNINLIKNENQKIINKTISLSLTNSKPELKLNYYSPLYLQFYKNISDDSFSEFRLDNTFILVNSIYNIPYIIYSTKSKSIISKNALNFQKICEIKNAHDIYITNFRHFLDEEKNRDIIMSISAGDNNIKLWDLKNWDLLSDIKKINNRGSLFSACFFRNKKEKMNFIITSNDYYSNSERMKIIDFKGNKIKEISDSNYRTYLVDIFNDDKLDKDFIVTGNELGVISYDIEKNKIYHKYIEFSNELFNNDHNSFIVTKDKNFVKIIESCEDGFVRIWDFHNGKLLNKIEIKDKKLYGICLWNDNFLLVGSDDEEKSLKLIELKKNFVINNIKTEGIIINSKKIIHKKFNECLIVQDWKNHLKLFVMKN